MLRGFALCGIVWLNVPGLTRWTFDSSSVHNVAPWLEPLFRGRFIGLFAALFGISFALVLRGAGRRTRRPRLVLVRRFAFLLLLGLVHQLLQPGEVLTTYASVGLLLLLPLSWIPQPWVPLVLGVLALTGAAALHLEPGQNAVGMVLIGYAAAGFGLPQRLERPGRGLALAGLILLPSYAAIVFLQYTVKNSIVDGVADGYTWADFAAGVAGAALYGTAVALALTTRLRPALRAVFEPLGRLALTNYIGATLLALLARPLLHTGPTTSTAPDLLLARTILLLQIPASHWWLARYRYANRAAGDIKSHAQVQTDASSIEAAPTGPRARDELLRGKCQDTDCWRPLLKLSSALVASRLPTTEGPCGVSRSGGGARDDIAWPDWCSLNSGAADADPATAPIEGDVR